MTTYPARRPIPWEVDEGRVVLEPPEPPSRIERWVRRLLRAPRRSQVRLDDEGTRAWLLADGTRTLGEAAREIAAELDPSTTAEEARVRLERFYAALVDRGALELRAAPEPTTDPLRGFPHHEEVPCGCGRTVRVPGDRDGAVRYRCPACGERRVHEPEVPA